MPNKGYPLVAANFIKKFSLRVNENDVIRDLKRIRAHCVKHDPQLTGERGSIRDVSLRNQRYTEHSINKEAVSMLNVIIKEYLIDHPVNGMTHLAIIYQTAQDCHDIVAYKPPKATGWRDIIKEKLNDLTAALTSVLRWRNDKEELEEAKRFMGKYNRRIDNEEHVEEVIQRIEEAKTREEMKLNASDFKRRLFNANRMFELFTGRFFRNLEQKHQVDESKINSGMLIDYWSQMWTKATEPPTGVERYTTELTSYAPMVGFPDRGEFETIIKHTDNWKSPGADGIFNYYIKWLTELHDILHRQTMKVALGEAPLEEWMCRGITYLFPKNDTPTNASQYRPITCMSNLYKITTKCVTEALQREIKIRGLLTENQMGTMRKVQGAKEHALANIAINAAHKCRLYSTWIDITKAFDSVDHEVLEHVIRRLKLPNWMTNFILDTIKRWTIDIRWHKECIIEGKKIERESSKATAYPPSSSRLRQLYPSVQIRTSDSREFGTNHLLYIDDLKLLAKDEDVMQKMTKETEEYLTHIGLIINRDKSATNSSRCADTARLLEGPETYKYLGITETRYSSVSRGMYSRIHEEIKKRVNMLLDTDLSAKNLFRAVNQYALTVPNYYIGVVPLEPYQFARLDRMVRKQLYEKGAHKHCANISRLYLPRKELGGGTPTLHSSLHTCTTRTASPYATTKPSRRRSNTYGSSKTDRCTTRELDSVDLEESTLWLRKSMLTPQEEAKLINLQDRNLQWMSSKKNHKKCGKYLDATTHGLRATSQRSSTQDPPDTGQGARSEEYQESGTLQDRRSEIHQERMDLVRHEHPHGEESQFNRPDIIVADKRKNRITIVEIGITSQNNLVKTEMEKKDKYQDLGKQMKFQTFGNHDTEIVIIPWVMTWDGVVTEFHNSYRRQLGISDRMEAQLQRIVLQQSHNFVLRELGVAATGITCECDPARKRQAANMDRGPPLKEREVQALARRPALPSAAPALANAVEALPGYSKAKEGLGGGNVAGLFNAVCDGLRVFIGYSGTRQLEGKGIGLSNSVGGYTSSYEQTATWKGNWQATDTNSQTCAHILLGTMPLLYFGLTYLFWMCCRGWKLKTIAGDNNGSDLYSFMSAMGYDTGKLNSDVTGTKIAKLLGSEHNAIEDLKTLYSSVSPNYPEFLKQMNQNGKDELSQKRAVNAPLYVLYAASSQYLQSQVKPSKIMELPQTQSDIANTLNGYSEAVKRLGSGKSQKLSEAYLTLLTQIQSVFNQDPPSPASSSAGAAAGGVLGTAVVGGTAAALATNEAIDWLALVGGGFGGSGTGKYSELETALTKLPGFDGVKTKVFNQIKPQGVILKLAKGLGREFMGYDSQGGGFNFNGKGIILNGRENYTSKYQGATWDGSDNNGEMARIFLGAVVIIFLGLSFLDWKCRQAYGGWATEYMTGSSGWGLGQFMKDMGYSPEYLNGNKNGTAVASLLEDGGTGFDGLVKPETQNIYDNFVQALEDTYKPASDALSSPLTGCYNFAKILL
ncbi:reverse-transcriptase domain containing protein,putative [Babesia caballi]|uniref:Reverse-transcriptase domain containing protein,putative n=1 Tax=Babesia caballi TaxID=5871 RepID=A0AAV4LR92_BABCB|nr:reverse-transcriptase domain containing protein,putative [Babesia caballi]